jgi:hypothetical protein
MASNSAACCIRKYSQPSRKSAFPNASIGNPGNAGNGPPIKTFGGDDFGKIVLNALIPESFDTSQIPVG